MKKVELFMVGGFLGAGKTTSILKMALNLKKQGKKAAIITNDQGEALVDTNLIKSSGFPVLEVTGSCFCCNFPAFADKIGKLIKTENPDVIIAEPVGSCTDLVATICKPIKEQQGAMLDVKPFSVLIDPQKIKDLMSESPNLSIETAYLLRKQIEEADIVVLNKIDLLAENEITAIKDFIHNNIKNTAVVDVSAQEDINIDRWLAKIYEERLQPGPSIDVDYELYAKAEARLGWLNFSADVTVAQALDVNELLKELGEAIRGDLKLLKYEIAHLKIYVGGESDWAKAGTTSLAGEFKFSRLARGKERNFNLILNARVDTSPEELMMVINRQIAEMITYKGLDLDKINLQCFKPGKPNPTYRM